MKKLVMLIAVAVASAFVHGAAVTWSATKVMTPSDSGTALQGAVAYLFDAATVSSSAAVAAIEGGTFADVVGSSLSTASSGTTGGISKVGQNLPASYVGGDSVTLYAVIFDSSDLTSGNYIVTAAKTAALKATGATTFAFGSQADATWTTYGGSTPEGTPEPTSGLLLLVGGAMLALRRKQK